MNVLRKHPFVTVFSIALILRGLFALFYISSPFSHFHEVPGLDMETLLRFGEWETPGNVFFFTFHRLQVFLFRALNGGTHEVLMHVLWQALLGAAGGVMLADIMLKLSGKRVLALAAGVLFVLNPVELMYEFTPLQESLVNFLIILSVWSFLEARKHHFAPLYALCAGAAAGAAGSGRPVATGLALLLAGWCFYYLFRRRLPLKRSGFFAAGVLCVWIILSSVNLVKTGTFTCFFNPLPYTLSYNTASAAAQGEKGKSSAETSALPPLVRTCLKMAIRIPALWNPVEIPENLNIYFLKDKLPPLRLPFEFLMAFAAAGVIMMAATGRWNKKEGIILLPILALAFFLCVREPIGRYRLLMLPWFILLTVWSLEAAAKNKKHLAGVFLIAGAVMLSSLPQVRPLRAADFSAWGWALEKEAQGKITPEVIRHFIGAYYLRPDANNAISLITRAMRTENPSLARGAAAHWMRTSGNSSLACYYAALAAFPDRREIKRFLDMVKVEQLPPLLQFRYYFMQGDVSFKSGASSEAVKYYKAALRLAQGSPAQRRYAENMIKKLETKK